MKALVCALALLAATAARADPGYYVVTAYPDAGLRTIDLRYWTVKPDGGGEVKWPELGFRYGVTQRWTTEVFASWITASFIPTQISSWNWSNDFLLTQGQWPVDVTLHTQLIRNRGFGNAVEFGPALQTDVGRTQLNFNLFWDRAYNTPYPRPTELKYQWQVRHRWLRRLHAGAQGFGEVGPWDDWLAHAAQSHRAGPALFGSFDLGGRQSLDWSAAYLVGRTYGEHGHMFSARAAFSF